MTGLNEQKRTKAAKPLKIIISAVFFIVLALFIVNSGMTPGHDSSGYKSVGYATVLSLLPPLVSITMALITKEVYSSLFTGIVIGALIYANGNLELAYNTLLYNKSAGMIVNITDISHAGILVFAIFLSWITALVNISGGASAFGEYAQKKIKSRVQVEFATMLLGVIIFIDDYFNCLTVGSVMRPVTDKFKVSRAKLAYLIDATAAPVCIIAPVSSWAAAVTSAVPEHSGINGFTMFLRTIPYNFYALLTLLFMVITILTKIDYGPMKVHEDNALKGDLYTTPERPFAEDEKTEKKANGTVLDMVLPVLFLIFSAIFFMLYTGGIFQGKSFVDAFAGCNAAKSLVMASLLTILATLLFYKIRNLVSFHDSMEGLTTGFKSMSSPILILILAWTLSSMTNLLGANIFIHDFVASQAGGLKMFLPLIIFVISVVLSFATGTSWGIFTILIPIVCNVFPDNYEMLVISIAACLAGSVCGDHCSPISDTTIMSSAGARCFHVNHVSTQLPYAMTVAGVSGFGYLVAGIVAYNTGSGAAILSLPISAAMLVVVLFVIKKRTLAKAE